MRFTKLFSLQVVVAFAQLGLVTHSRADMIFVDRVAFESSLPAGYFFNDFSTLADSIGPEAAISQSGGSPNISYNISATGGTGVFPVAGEPFKSISNWFPLNSVVVEFTSGNVRSAGANFWLTDENGDRVTGEVNVVYRNGANGVVPSSASGSYSYLGLTSDAIILGLSFSAGPNQFVNFSNFSAAVAIPEPSSLLLLGFASCAVGIRRRR